MWWYVVVKIACWDTNPENHSFTAMQGCINLHPSLILWLTHFTHSCLVRINTTCYCNTASSREQAGGPVACDWIWICVFPPQVRLSWQSSLQKNTLTSPPQCASSQRCSTQTVWLTAHASRASYQMSQSWMFQLEACLIYVCAHLCVLFPVYADGSICLDILQNRWSPTYDVSSILTSIQVRHVEMGAE